MRSLIAEIDYKLSLFLFIILMKGIDSLGAIPRHLNRYEFMIMMVIEGGAEKEFRLSIMNKREKLDRKYLEISHTNNNKAYSPTSCVRF